MSGLYTEADYENSVIELFRNDLGYEYVYGPDIERDFYNPLYEEVLLDSLYRLNRELPDDAIQDALEKCCIYGLFAKWNSSKIFCRW